MSLADATASLAENCTRSSRRPADDPVKVIDRDAACAYFAVGAMRRNGKRHDKMLRASSKLAREMKAAGEPGRDISSRTVGALLSRPSTDVRMLDYKVAYDGSYQGVGPIRADDLTAGGKAPFHVTLETVAVQMMMAEQVEGLTSEDETEDADAAAIAPTELPTLGQLKVLITGATGCIGVAVAKKLTALGASVTATSREPDTDGVLATACARFVHCADLTTAGAAAALCDGQHAIVHADDALITPGARAWEAARQDHVHVASTAALLLAAKTSGVGRFVHLSTAALYHSGTDHFFQTIAGLPFIGSFFGTQGMVSAKAAVDTERTPPAALLGRTEWSGLPLAARSTSPYTRTKLQAEVTVQDASVNGLCTVVLRPSEILSPTHEGGTLPRLLAARFMPATPDACVDVTHVDNVAHAVALALQAKRATVSGRTYNIGSHEPLRLWPMLEQLRERLGLPRDTPPRRVPLTLSYVAAFAAEMFMPSNGTLTTYHVAERSVHRILDTTAAKRDLGYTPLVSARETVRRYAREASGAAEAPSTPHMDRYDTMPPAGSTPQAAVVALWETAMSSPERPALLTPSDALPSTRAKRMHLRLVLLLALLAILMEVLFATLARVYTPVRVSPNRWSPRPTKTGLTEGFAFVLIGVAFYILTSDDRLDTHTRVLRCRWSTISYGQLAGLVAAQADTLRRAGVKAGSKVLLVSSMATRAHEIALSLALHAAGATLLIGEPADADSIRALAKAMAPTRPDVIVCSPRDRLLLGVLRLLGRGPSGYTCVSAASLSSWDTTGYQSTQALQKAKPPAPNDAALAALIVGSAVGRAGGVGVGALGGSETRGSSAVLTPVTHATLREQARVYGDAAAGVHARGVPGRAASGVDAKCSFEGARWVSLPCVSQYAMHDVANGGCAVLHPMALGDPEVDLCPHAIHSLVTRFDVSVLVAPPVVWRKMSTALPAGALQSVALPLSIGMPLAPRDLRASDGILRPTVVIESGGDAAAASPSPKGAANNGLITVWASMDGLPVAACTSLAAYDAALLARLSTGSGVCAGVPLAPSQLSIDDAADGIGEVVLTPGSLGGSKPPAKIRTGEAGSLDPHGRLWLHGALPDFVRTVTSGIVPPLDLEHVVMATGVLRWCALVGAPLAVSASATVLVVQLFERTPQDASKELKWGPELRVVLREAILKSRFASLSGTVRILEHRSACPTMGGGLDREALRVWAARRLRKIGAEKLSVEDRLDSAQRLKTKKVD